MSNWQNDLIKCPSQCYLDVDDNITLYMRWRHFDPWQFAVIRNIDADNGGDWAYPANIPEFTHDEYEKAQRWFENWYRENKNNIKFEE